jgi:hypothetical protein
MSVSEGTRERESGLAAVQALERRLDGRGAEADAARTRVEAARDRAERIVAEARAAAEQRAARRRERVLAAAEREAEEVHRAAHERGRELHASLRRERDGAVAALLELVLPETRTAGES